MVSQKVTIKNPTGLHLRPAGILCKKAMQYRSSIRFRFRNTTANAKSVLSVLGACVKAGDEVLKVGSTGYSTGPHAHFEVRLNGVVTDPMPYITNGVVPSTQGNETQNEETQNTTN